MNLKDRLTKASKERNQILMGEFTAVVESAKTKTFKSGSFGFVFIYGITDKESKGRKVYENLVLTDKDGKAVEYGDDRLLRRLYTLGIGDAELPNFALPENDTEEGDLPKLNGIKVILTLEKRINKGTGEGEQGLKKVARIEVKAKAA